MALVVVVVLPLYFLLMGYVENAHSCIALYVSKICVKHAWRDICYGKALVWRIVLQEHMYLVESASIVKLVAACNALHHPLVLNVQLHSFTIIHA